MNVNKHILLLLGLILSGIALRLFAMLGGHNYDFDSYLIVLRIIEKSKSVYAETTRYNYAPIWFNIMWVLYKLAGFDKNIFRVIMVLFLSLVDVFIFLILKKKVGMWSASFFFLNPISIFITGFHNQFDNLAILLALYSAILIGDDFTQSLNKRKFAGLFFLGLSLMTKHIFFMYPVWLAVKQKGITAKLWIMLIPTALFLLSFIPYIDTGASGIIQNVFLYRSYANGVFYNFFVPLIFQILMSSEIFWLVVLIFFAFYFKEANNLESCFYYLCLLVVTAPAIANQYLAIPLVFLTINFNTLSILCTLLGTIHLVTDIDGLQLFTSPEYDGILRTFFYLLMIIILALSFVWMVYTQNFRNMKRAS